MKHKPRAAQRILSANSQGTPTTLARLNANLSLEDAAKRSRISIGYLRQIEHRGSAPYSLAKRLSALYGCPLTIFLYPTLGSR